MGINPSLEDDADVVVRPPSDAALADCEKVVEGDVEVLWKNIYSV
jgi:hypothetical protein